MVSMADPTKPTFIGTWLSRVIFIGSVGILLFSLWMLYGPPSHRFQDLVQSGNQVFERYAAFQKSGQCADDDRLMFHELAKLDQQAGKDWSWDQHPSGGLDDFINPHSGFVTYRIDDAHGTVVMLVRMDGQFTADGVTMSGISVRPFSPVLPSTGP